MMHYVVCYTYYLIHDTYLWLKADTFMQYFLMSFLCFELSIYRLSLYHCTILHRVTITFVLLKVQDYL
jgi:hypothetical protein